MAKNLYIDASHPNETRVVLKSNDNIEDYEYESVKNTLIKNEKTMKINNIKLCQRIYTLMLRILMKLELYLNQRMVLKITSTKV